MWQGISFTKYLLDPPTPPKVPGKEDKVENETNVVYALGELGSSWGETVNEQSCKQLKYAGAQRDVHCALGALMDCQATGAVPKRAWETA